VDQLNRVFSLIALTAGCAFGLAQAEPAKAAPVATTVVTAAVSPAQAQEAVAASAPAQQPVAGSAPTAVNPPPVSAPPAAQVPAPVVNVVPVKTVYVAENQPVQIIDGQGRLLQIIYLKRK